MHKRTSAVLASISLAFAGSASADEAKPPSALEVPSLDKNVPALRLTLREVAKRATERHPQVVIAMREVERAEGLLQQQRAPALPRLTANGTYTRLDNDRLVQDRVFQAGDQLNANITLAVPLIAPTAWAQWARARRAVGVQELTVDDTRRTVAVAAGRASLAVVAQRRIVETSARAIAAARSHANFARDRFKGGVGNRLDLVRAEQEVAQSERDAETALGSLTAARETLGVLIANDGAVDIDDAGLAILDAAKPTVDLAVAEKRRADLRVSRARFEAASASRRDSYTDFFPALSGQFAPFYQNPASATVPTTGWTAQLILGWNLYDGGLRYGLKRERAAQEAQAEETFVANVRQMRSDARVASDAIQHADAAAAAARRFASQAREALDLATIAYRAGATTNLEVIDAERRSRDADAGVVIAEDAARRARLDALVAEGSFP